MDYPTRSPLMLQNFRFTSRQVALISTFIAIGAVVRVGVDQVGDMVPVPIFSLVIKLGLSETLTFVSGFIYGPVAGFVTGFLIILLSDIASPFGAGAWTPFVAAIIGLLGIIAGSIRRVRQRPSVWFMTISAVGLTLLSEFLQNSYFALLSNIPIVVAMGEGFPSLLAAVANNAILFPTVGTQAINFIQDHHLNGSTENHRTRREQ
jgi:uncharacterized membrane protein